MTAAFGWVSVDTPAMLELRDYAHEAIAHNLVIGVEGPSGTGKSHMLNSLADTVAIPVRRVPILRPLRARAVLVEICRALDPGYVPKGGVYSILREIHQRLQSHPALLVIDEAQQLGRDAFESIQAVHDDGRTPCAIVIAGIALQRQLETNPPMATRISRWVTVGRLTGDALITQLGNMHALLAGTDPLLLHRIDATFRHGQMRRWRDFTLAAHERLPQDATGIDEQAAAACVRTLGLTWR